MPWSNQGGGWQPGGGNQSGGNDGSSGNSGSSGSGSGGSGGPWGRGPRRPESGGGGDGSGNGGGRGPSGGGPFGGGPFGSGGGPFGSQRPPDLEEILRRSQDRLKNILPSGSGSFRGLVLVALVGVAVWLGTGFYRVDADEQGVVLRFGRYVKTTDPGLNYRLPWPIESVLTPKVTSVNREEIGFRSADSLGGRSTSVRDVVEESLMLTGDENIVDVDFTVFWQIKDAGQFLFNIESPSRTIKAVAESAMREVVGKNKIQGILTEGRQQVADATRALMQQVLDSYGAGIVINQVNLQKVDPPAAVIDAFRDVQAAQADRERAQNEAEAYRNDIIPRARGEAQRLLQQAEAYKQEVINNAQGDASRFLAVYNEYKQARDVTSKRMYLETMEQIMRGTNKVIIDQGSGGVVPYLPLPELKRPGTAAPAQNRQ